MLPDDVDAADLAPEVRAELRSLSRPVAETVARHLVMTGRVIDDDPEEALAHALAARRMASRIAAVREATGLAAYRAGEWQTAVSELRTYHRMSGRQTHLAILADCERALGRPERAVDLYRSADREQLEQAEAIELLIVGAAARADMGQQDAAVSMLQVRELTADAPWVSRLRYAYADALLSAGRRGEAREWFVRVAEADEEGETDAAERLLELDGVVLTEDENDDELNDENDDRLEDDDELENEDDDRLEDEDERDDGFEAEDGFEGEIRDRYEDEERVSGGTEDDGGTDDGGETEYDGEVEELDRDDDGVDRDDDGVDRDRSAAGDAQPVEGAPEEEEETLYQAGEQERAARDEGPGGRPNAEAVWFDEGDQEGVGQRPAASAPASPEREERAGLRSNAEQAGAEELARDGAATRDNSATGVDTGESGSALAADTDIAAAATADEDSVPNGLDRIDADLAAKRREERPEGER
ncbi:tetratricopeptide repeat protein [Rhizomonospora bruguierae]|uniref:hypothetical protein n=1 Tax=Rhizomonospora bruguierae TaxID=1581705 RepID=UPI0035E44518